MNRKVKTSVILLAGGMGTRMLSPIPKQFLAIDQKPIACYSFELFLAMPEIDEIIVVCSPEFRELFKNANASRKPVAFALPGARRQDSVYNGFQMVSNEWVCIHDAARPFIDIGLVLRVLESGHKHGAATAAIPVKFTVKESDTENFVKNTPDRNKLWEIQTPQVLSREIMAKGFEYANLEDVTVTDDVSLAELIGRSVKLVEGSHINLKVTVPSDLKIAHQLLQSTKQ